MFYKLFKVIILLCIILSGSTSCSNISVVKKSLNAKLYTLSYLHQTDTVKIKQEKSITIDTISVTPFFSFNSLVDKKKNFILPLLFFNTWTTEYQSTLGKNCCKENFQDFYKASLINEINRSSNLSYSHDKTADYKLSIEVTKLKTTSEYIKTGYMMYLVFGYSYNFQEITTPAISLMDVTYIITKKDSIIYNGRYRNEYTTPTYNKNITNYASIDYIHRISMIDAISQNIRLSIEQISKDINKLID